MGDEQLSVEEANAVEMFKITDNTTTSSIAASEEKLSFEEEMRRAVEAKKSNKGTREGLPLYSPYITHVQHS